MGGKSRFPISYGYEYFKNISTNSHPLLTAKLRLKLKVRLRSGEPLMVMVRVLPLEAGSLTEVINN
jgi:hypothetical protein